MSVYVIAFVIGVGCLLLRLWFLKYDRVVNRLLSEWSGTERGFDVCMCCNITGYDSFLAAGGPVRFISMIISSIVCGVLSILYVGCMASERCFILGKISNQITRLKRS